MKLSSGRRCSAEPQEEKILNQSSNSSSTGLILDSLSNTFQQRDLMRNARQEIIQGQEAHNTVITEITVLEEEEILLQQKTIMNEQLMEMRETEKALQLLEVHTKMQGYRGEGDWCRIHDLYWKLNVYRKTVFHLLERNSFMESRIEWMKRILSKQKSAPHPDHDQDRLNRISTSFIQCSSLSTPNPPKANVVLKLASTGSPDGDLKMSTSRVDLQSRDQMYQDMCKQCKIGSTTQQTCSSSSTSGSQGPKSSYSHASRTADECFSRNELIANLPVNSKSAKYISSRLKEKSTTSERSKAGFRSNGARGSYPRSSSRGRPRGLPPVRYVANWGHGEDRIVCVSLPVKGIVSHQGQIKTELCKNWEQSGRCPYTLNCRFAHGAAELRPVLRHPLYKTQICRMLMEGKECIYGHRCHFRHFVTDDEISFVVSLRNCSQALPA